MTLLDAEAVYSMLLSASTRQWCERHRGRRCRTTTPQENLQALDRPGALRRADHDSGRRSIFLWARGTGKSTAMAGLRAAWEAEHAPAR